MTGRPAHILALASLAGALAAAGTGLAVRAPLAASQTLVAPLAGPPAYAASSAIIASAVRQRA